jgi:hypothetical protein
MSKIIADHQQVADATETVILSGDIRSFVFTYIGFLQGYRNEFNHPLSRKFYIADNEDSKVFCSLIKCPTGLGWDETPRLERNQLVGIAIGNAQPSHAMSLTEVFGVVHLSCHGLNDHFMWSFKVGSRRSSDLIYQELPTDTKNIWKEGIASVNYAEVGNQ